MSMERIRISVVGAGRLAELISQRLQARADVHYLGLLSATQNPAADTDCILYLPTSTGLASGSDSTRISELLKSGFDVISSAPLEALDQADISAACRTGKSTFHGSGGFQSRLISRFNRAFAAISRNIESVELIEELDIEAAPAHPWEQPADSGIEEKKVADLTRQAEVVDGYYQAALQLLSDAVFDSADQEKPSKTKAARVTANALERSRGSAEAAQMVVQRSLGERVIYDSIWSRRDANSVPLQYRFNSTSSDAIGHVSIRFHRTGELHPTDHLTCQGVLEAIQAVHHSKPGILRHDLDIWQVKADDRL